MSPRYLKALTFAKEVHKNQKRRVTGIAYIQHPISVAERIAKVSENEDIIISGLLHDTIEDCEPYGSVTEETLTKLFGKKVASLVADVTEVDKTLSWETRKQHALLHIEEMDNDALLLKSADLLDNLSDIDEGVTANGLGYFDSFKRGPQQTIQNYIAVFTAIVNKWPENPLLPELLEELHIVTNISGIPFREIEK